MTFQYSQLRECMLQTPLPLAPAVIVVRRDERRTSGYAAFGIFKTLWLTRALENKVQLWPFYAVLSEDFCIHENLSLKFM